MDASVLGRVFTLLGPDNSGVVAEDSFQPRVSLLAQFVAITDE
jgi:hypothetical protein